MNELLEMPWTEWLDAFEAHLPARMPQVTLEPDPASPCLDVEAQADTMDELLDFAKALERSPLVARVDTLADGESTREPDSPPCGPLHMRWRVSLREAALLRD